jgi:hypothetical protein
MRLVHRFLSKPAAERRLVLRALTLVALVRMGLWVVPFKRLRTLVSVSPDAHRNAAARHAPDAIVRAVVAASRRVPAASCLTQALAAQRLLAREGYDSKLEIGVARSEAGTFEAHAWLVRDGRIVIGEIDGLTRYVPMRSPGADVEAAVPEAAAKATGRTVRDAVSDSARGPVRDDT